MAGGDLGDDLVRRFDGKFSYELQAMLFRRVKRAYKRAWETSQKLAGPLGTNAAPFLRWAMIDNEMRLVAVKYRAEGVSSRIALSGSWTKYTKMTSGSVVLTASSVGEEWMMPRSASHRNSLALDNQALLFPDMHDPPNPDDPLYAILVHHADALNLSAPAFANIRFPHHDLKRWLPGRIELFKRFPTRRQVKQDFNVEEIENQALAKLREDAPLPPAKEGTA